MLALFRAICRMPNYNARIWVLWELPLHFTLGYTQTSKAIDPRSRLLSLIPNRSPARAPWLYTFPIKSVTSGTQLLATPCRYCHAAQLRGRIMICGHHTTASCSLTWAAPSSLNYSGHTLWICTQILWAEIRACATYARLCALLGARSVAASRETTRHWFLSLFAQLHLYLPSLLRTAVYRAATPRMACRVHLVFCHVPGNTNKEHGLARDLRGGWLTI
jgi:hypothetical protein